MSTLATILPEGFSEEILWRDLEVPTAIAFSADGRVFVAEKSGLIKTFDSIGAPAPTIFADLRTEVHNAWDHGLMNLELHPEFPAVPYVYVVYALDALAGETPPRWGSPGQTSDPCPNASVSGCPVGGRLSRLEAAGGRMVGEEVVLLENWCQQFPSHSLGGLAFDSAGALYVSAGEGAHVLDVDYGQHGTPANPCDDPPTRAGTAPSPPGALGGALRSQNDGMAGFGQATFGGKVLRIDPISGSALPDNPLAGSAVAGADRIIALGLRQPFRLAVRPGTKELWIGDVGWGVWEEINRLEDPASPELTNFGWPCFEGPEAQAAYSFLGLTACESLYANPGAHRSPYFAYRHDEPVVAGEPCTSGSSSITGLTFYEGGDYPESFAGALFFSDYARGCIWVMEATAQGIPDAQRREVFAADAPAPIDLKVGPNGDLFYADVAEGTVRRITFSGDNHRPVVVLDAQPTSGAAPLTVQFDASRSEDPDGDRLSFAWDLDGDGATDDATQAAPSFTYHVAGQTTVTLLVTDERGASARKQVIIEAGGAGAPAARILTPHATLEWTVRDRIEFSGAGDDPQDGALPPQAFSWSLVLHHCPLDSCHAHLLQDFNGVQAGSFIAPDHEYPSHLELKLTVRDAGGLTGTARALLYPRATELHFTTAPNGLQLALASEGQAAPFSRTVIAGSNLTVTAPSPQRIGCRTYAFQSWSDGGEQSHEIRAPLADTQLRATFRLVSDPLCTQDCHGDCNASGSVEVDELVTTVAIAMGDLAVSHCTSADIDGDTRITIDELLQAVIAALEGCGNA